MSRAVREMNSDQVEKIIDGLSVFLVSRLKSLGYQRYGIEQEDLLQEIHIKVWKALAKNNGNIKYFNAYLNKIIHSVFINEINRSKKEKDTLKFAEIHLRQTRDLIDADMEKDLSVRKTVATLIDSLRDSRQLVVKLRLEGFSFKDIAFLNGWSYRKTCNIFYRALGELKRKLIEKGIIYED